MNARGSVFKYGDNVDTDVIIPARHLNTQDAKELASHCMEDIDKDFVNRVKAGDIMVGGGTSAAALPASTRPSASRQPASRWSSPRALPASSTATPSTSVCRFWSARPPVRQLQRATPFRWTLTPASSPTRRRAGLPGRPVPAVYPEHHLQGRPDEGHPEITPSPSVKMCQRPRLGSNEGPWGFYCQSGDALADGGSSPDNAACRALIRTSADSQRGAHSPAKRA